MKKLEKQLLSFHKIGKFKLSSGHTSNEYYDIKEAMGTCGILEEILIDMQERILEKPDVIIGLELGGIPLAVGLSMRMKIPFAIMRKRKHLHGMQNRIEGYQKRGKILLVDDVRTTGSSLIEAKKALEKLGYKVIQIETVITRSNK